MSKDPFEILNEVQRQEAPPFLLTRIYAKVENAVPEQFKTPVSLAMAAGFCLLVVLNLSVIGKKENSEGSKSGVESFQFLNSTNSLYQ